MDIDGCYGIWSIGNIYFVSFIYPNILAWVIVLGDTWTSVSPAFLLRYSKHEYMFLSLHLSKYRFLIEAYIIGIYLFLGLNYVV